MKGYFLPSCPANRANLVSMPHIGSDAVEVEGVGAFCGENGVALAWFH